MAQGVAWWARKRGVRCTVVLPDTAPETKIAAIRRLGADMIPVAFDEWHEVFRTRTFEGLDGLHVHAFSDDAVMAGNGTIGLEIVEDLPDVDAVIAPYGGGGLSCGIASALRAVAPSCKVFAAEVATAAPLAPSLEAGQPVQVEYTPSFVDGIGVAGGVPGDVRAGAGAPGRLARREPDEIEDAVRLLAERGARSSPRAPARRRWRSRSPERPATARSSASSRAGTSTRRSSPRSSPARVPASRPKRATRLKISSIEAQPARPIVRSKSARKFSSTSRTPSSPAMASPYAYGRPIRTALAPSATALNASAPPRTPLSSRIGTCRSTASTIAGRASTVAISPSICLPTVIRDDQPVDASVHGPARVLGMKHAFQQDRELRSLAQEGQIVPGERGPGVDLEETAGRLCAAAESGGSRGTSRDKPGSAGTAR